MINCPFKNGGQGSQQNKVEPWNQNPRRQNAQTSKYEVKNDPEQGILILKKVFKHLLLR